MKLKRSLSVFLAAAMLLGCLCAASAVDGTSPDAVNVVFGADAHTSVGFTWYTKYLTTDNAWTKAQIAPDGAEISSGVIYDSANAHATTALQNRYYSHEQMMQFGAEPEKQDYCMHQLRVEGLEPGTKYRYRVGREQAWSAVGTFETAASGGAFTFVSITDIQGASDEQLTIAADTLAAAMAQAERNGTPARFMANTGDFIDSVSMDYRAAYGHFLYENEEEWHRGFNLARDAYMGLALVPAAGNHDLTENAFMNHFALSPDGSSDTANGAYFSFDYSNAHFVVLNTNENYMNEAGVYPGTGLMSDAQVSWLRQDVAQARKGGAQWTVVLVHRGPYTVADHATEPDVIALRAQLIPLMDELDVDLVLQGHEHAYARTWQLTNHQVENTVLRTEDGVTYAMDPAGVLYLNNNTAGYKSYQPTVTDPAGPEFDAAYAKLFAEANQPSSIMMDVHQEGFHSNDKTTYSLITVDGDRLIYRNYTYDVAGKTSALSDQYAIWKETGEARAGLYGDLPQWANEAVYALTGAGVLPKTGSGTFGSGGTVSASELGGMLSSLSGGAVDAGALALSGADALTRQDAADALWQYAALAGIALPAKAPGFADSDRIPAGMRARVGALQAAGIISGKDGNRFDPDAAVTRAECAVMLFRLADFM